MQEMEYKIEAFVCQRKNMERDGVLTLFDHWKVMGDGANSAVSLNRWLAPPLSKDLESGTLYPFPP